MKVTGTQAMSLMTVCLLVTFLQVYLPAISGIVSPEIVRTLASFLEVCYLARRSFLTDSTLVQLEEAHERFKQHRVVFKDSGVRPNGFSLPRQHSLEHYPQHIRNFGAPNGICSSMTEAKHIKAVKEPWRRSNRFEALGQMLLTNQRLEKLSAARVDFTARGMMTGTCLSAAYAAAVQATLDPDHADQDSTNAGDFDDDNSSDEDSAPDDGDDAGGLDSEERAAGNGHENGDHAAARASVIDGPRVTGFTVLAKKPGTSNLPPLLHPTFSVLMINFNSASLSALARSSRRLSWHPRLSLPHRALFARARPPRRPSTRRPSTR